ncbi:hypothetical protein PPERSA_03229 [Pseudocohnilembus persalinus]|uniref:Actin-related protein n=1 Tax=Pseudocohnilembus persalinus TaxID=266149 RepID=A0A0V0QYT7_PSEPJ|nr:hypothetical protein PPERSA_03229 [Pseudocohnilembus persalinus]|eukprot:KRX07396.1 hypothetical protein PPERSA_03229 [Pseudocohnilembus persalinus]
MYLPGSNKNPNFQIPVIIEFGTLNTRVGYGGHDCPQAIIPTDYVQKDEDLQGLDWFSPLLPEKGDHKQFIKNGQIQDWDVVGKFIRNIMKNTLHTQQYDVPLFLVEPPMQTRENRIKMVELMFEECNFSSFYMHKGPLLSSYIFAKDTILLIDSGAEGTYIIPIQEGYINQKALMRTEIGGEYLTKQLSKILTQKKQIKSFAKNYDNLSPSLKNWSQMELIREIKHNQCKLLEFSIDNFNFNDAVDSTVYDLPDGQKIELGKEIYEIPEMMFQEIPECNFMGLNNLVRQVIEKVETDQRKELIQNIMIVGGNSQTLQFEQRLQKEITDIDIFGLQNKCKTFTPPNKEEKLYSSWLGASIVGSMNTFDSMLMTKRDYEEHGSILIERKILG